MYLAVLYANARIFCNLTADQAVEAGRRSVPDYSFGKLPRSMFSAMLKVITYSPVSRHAAQLTEVPSPSARRQQHDDRLSRCTTAVPLHYLSKDDLSLV